MEGATTNPSQATGGRPHTSLAGYATGRGLLILTTQAGPAGAEVCRLTSIQKQEKVGASMSFTVVRAVRGSDLSPGKPSERLSRVSLLPSLAGSPAAMDLPYADEVLHLEITDFPETVPAGLE